MNPSRKVGPRRVPIIALLLWLCSCPVFADEAGVEPQTRTDAIKQEALQLGAKALGLESRILDRSGPGTTIYLSAGNSGASIVGVNLVIDGSPPVRHLFDPDETQALLRDGMYRLARMGLKAGAHQVHAEVLLQYAGDTEPRTLSLDDSCEIPDAGSELVLVPEGKNWLASPALKLHQQSAASGDVSSAWDLQRLWSAVNGPAVRDGTYRPGSDDDPRIGNARFFAETRDYFKAIVLLMQISAQAHDLALPPEYYQVLTSALIDYGTLSWAQDTYREALGAGIDAAAAAALRIRIAEVYYQRNDYAHAQQALGDSPSRRDKKQLTGWQDVKARILMAQGRFDEANGLLKATAIGADFESYVRYYNLGISLITDGLVPQGGTVLDRVGTIVSTDRDMLALSDSANLVLGSYLLQHGQGATAIPILERIQIRGRYSDRALLNLGWAWLAPAGQKQTRVMLGDERMVGPPPETVGALHGPFDDQNLYQRYHLRPFIRARLDGDKGAKTKQALAIWSELIGRDASSEPVQEGFLAAALALDNLGAHQEATELYVRAAAALESTSRSLDDSAAYVRGEQWVGDVLSAGKESTRFDHVLRNLPKPVVAMQLDNFIAGWSFQSGLQRYRDLDALAVNLKNYDAGLTRYADARNSPTLDDSKPAPVAGSDQDTARTVDSDSEELLATRSSVVDLRSRIDSSKSQEVVALRQQLLDDLSGKQQLLAKLLGGAQLEVARAYDGAMQRSD